MVGIARHARHIIPWRNPRPHPPSFFLFFSSIQPACILHHFSSSLHPLSHTPSLHHTHHSNQSHPVAYLTLHILAPVPFFTFFLVSYPSIRFISTNERMNEVMHLSEALALALALIHTQPPFSCWRICRDMDMDMDTDTLGYEIEWNG